MRRWLRATALLAACIWVNAQERVKVCELGGSSIQLSEAEVLAGRYPDVNGFQIPAACSTEIRSRVEQWKAQDGAAWDRLSNQACSHKLGWVEYTPGTCQAGGPPPICPANHWYRDPQRSMAQWNAEIARVRSERAEQLSRLACSCTARAVGENTQAQPQTAAAAAPSPVRSSYNAFGIPCSGSCPLPGYGCVEGFCQIQAAIVQAARAGGRYLLPEDLNNVVDRVGKAVAAINRPVLPAAPIFYASSNTAVLSPWLSAYRTKSFEMRGSLSELSKSLETLRAAAEKGGDIRSAEEDAKAKQNALRANLTMLQQYAAGIERDHVVGPPACAEVFSAENRMLAQSAATILGMEVSAAAWPGSRGGWPLDYAFIHADYHCGRGATFERVRFLSQVFGFCGPDMKAERVIADNAIFFAQVLKVSCALPATEIGTYVVREGTPERAEQARARDSREAGFRIVPWTASVDYLVRSCR